MESLESLSAGIGSAVARFPWVAFAVLFGSCVTGRLRQDSDVDVAVYIDSNKELEVEGNRENKEESALQVAIERATQRNADLLILNRAPATVCTSALLTGKTLLVRDRGLYTRYFLAVTNVAIDFLQTEREYREIAQRSRSISDLDKSRLLRILDFIDGELADTSKFNEVSLATYRTDKDMRRNFDRWVETLINAAIDAGKIVLSSELRPVPQTYAQILSDIVTVPGFSALEGKLAELAALRNIMAHEYLDLRFSKVKRFAQAQAERIGVLATLCREWLTKKPPADETHNGE